MSGDLGWSLQAWLKSLPPAAAHPGPRLLASAGRCPFASSAYLLTTFGGFFPRHLLLEACLEAFSLDEEVGFLFTENTVPAIFLL